MIITKCNGKIICDIKGCSNLSCYFVKKSEFSSDSDALKLCKTCAKSLSKGLNLALKDKENL